MELPLPGADILDFNRGVTDLDAVGKEASAYADAKVRGSLPSALGARHGPGPAALDQEGLCSIPWLPPDQRRLLPQGCPLARGPGHSRRVLCWGSAMCSHTETVWGTADSDIFPPKQGRKKTHLFLIVEIPIGSIDFWGILYKSI